MSELDINKYNNGKIYKILNTETDDVYVGSTCMELPDRMQHHINTQTRKQGRKLYQLMKTFGNHLFYIELVENYPCESKEALRQREGHYIKLMGNLNMCIAGRTKQEWMEENREHILTQNKEYYERTKEHKLEYQKSEKVTEWKNTKVECPCGGSYTKRHKAEHFKSARQRDYYEALTNPDIAIERERNSEQIKQERKEARKQQQQKYREDNKEVLAEQKKKYYEENKETINDYKKDWYNKNKEALSERVKKYAEEHREEKKEYDKQRYQNKKEELGIKIELYNIYFYRIVIE